MVQGTSYVRSCMSGDAFNNNNIILYINIYGARPYRDLIRRYGPGGLCHTSVEGSPTKQGMNMV